MKKIVVHRLYDEVTTANDIALLKLEKSIDFSKYGGTVAPICLPSTADTYYGEKVIAAGWGLLEENGEVPNKVLQSSRNYNSQLVSSQLQKVELEMLSMTSCRRDFEYNKRWITSRMVCAYSEVSQSVVLRTRLQDMSSSRKQSSLILIELEDNWIIRGKIFLIASFCVSLEQRFLSRRQRRTTDLGE